MSERPIRLADLLAEHGDHDDAITVLRPYTGRIPAAIRLAALLGEQGHGGEAVDVLHPHATDTAAGPRLLKLLADGSLTASPTRR